MTSPYVHAAAKLKDQFDEIVFNEGNGEVEKSLYEEAVNFLDNGEIQKARTTALVGCFAALSDVA